MERKTKAQIEEELTALHQEFARFKEQVRATAIDVAERQGWCPDGLNTTLNELGLRGKEIDYTVELDVTLRVVRRTADVDQLWRQFEYHNAGELGQPESRTPKRLQEIEELLGSGEYEIIDVEVNEVEDS